MSAQALTERGVTPPGCPVNPLCNGMPGICDGHCKPKRFDVRAIMANPITRRRLIVGTIIATQAREGIETTRE